MFNDARRIKTGYGELAGYNLTDLPVDYFLSGMQNTPSPRIQCIVALRRRLQNLARFRQLGNNPQSYENLEDPDRPVWWDCRSGQKIDQLKRSRSVIHGYSGDSRSHHEWLEAVSENFSGINYPLFHPLPTRSLTQSGAVATSTAQHQRPETILHQFLLTYAPALATQYEQTREFIEDQAFYHNIQP